MLVYYHALGLADISKGRCGRKQYLDCSCSDLKRLKFGQSHERIEIWIKADTYKIESLKMPSGGGQAANIISVHNAEYNPVSSLT